MKQFCISCLLLLFPLLVSAQQQVSISGAITDSLGHSLQEPALVLVLNKGELTKVAGTEFSEKFQIDYTPETGKEYVLYVFIPGYKDNYMEITGKRGDLGKVRMKELSVKLKEVLVKADALEHEVVFGDDKYKISNSVLSKEHDLMSLLSKIPGLFVVNNSVSIVGAGAPTFTINGLKPRPGELEMIRPDEIESVTVSTIRQVKFSTDGSIDIRLKKKLRDYLSAKVKNEAAVWGGGSYGENGSVHLSNKSGKWTNYLLYGYSLSKDNLEVNQYRETFLPEGSDILESRQDVRNKNQNHSIIFSPKYQINDESFIDMQYKFNHHRTDQTQYVASLHRTSALDESSKEETTFDDLAPSHNIALRYFQKVAKNQVIVFNVAYNNYQSDAQQEINEFFEDNTVTTLSLIEKKNQVYTADMEYTASLKNLFGQIALFSAGLDYAYIDSKTDRQNDRDSEFSSLVRVNDHSGSAYASFRFEKNKFFSTIGVRGNYNYRKESSDLIDDHGTFQVRPIVNLGYRFAQSVRLNLTYDAYNGFPSVSQLNPGKVFYNKYLYAAGNPDLKDMFSHSLTMSLSLPKNTFIKVGYNRYKDKIYSVLLPDEQASDVSKQTYMNIDKSQSVSASIGSWIPIKKHYLIWGADYYQNFVKIPYKDNQISYNHPSFKFRVQDVWSK